MQKNLMEMMHMEHEPVGIYFSNAEAIDDKFANSEARDCVGAMLMEASDGKIISMDEKCCNCANGANGCCLGEGFQRIIFAPLSRWNEVGTPDLVYMMSLTMPYSFWSGLSVNLEKSSLMTHSWSAVEKQLSRSQNTTFPELHTISSRKQQISPDEGAAGFSGKLNHGNSRYYVINDFYNMESDETLHILTHFKTYQQIKEYTCGACSALMVLNWFGATKYHEQAMEQLLESHHTKGTSVENLADFFDLIGWNVESHGDAKRKFESHEEFEAFVIDHIDRGIPIMIDWVDWAGHWQVLIGIDTCGTDDPYDDVLIFADPYDITDHFQDGYYTFSLGRFLGMWREGPCAAKSEPYQQPFVAAWPGQDRKYIV